MSARPAEELGSEGKWFGEDYGRNGLFGNAATRFDEPRTDEEKEANDLPQQFNPFQGDDGKRSAVAMETASTDDLMSGLFKKPMTDEGDVYTSLLSNQSYTSSREVSYLSEDLKPSISPATSSTLNNLSSTTYSFSSNTKMTSDLFDDMPKSLLSSDKTESYNYMDISHGDDSYTEQQAPPQSLVDTTSGGQDLLGSYMDKYTARDDEGKDEEDEGDEEENLGPALDSHSFPYVEEPSDEELSDYRSYQNLGNPPKSTSPVKITFTEYQPVAQTQSSPAPATVSERENVLSVGLQGVPTVTLSEPEDDSPASTPNTSPTQKDFPPHDVIKADTGKTATSKSGSGKDAGPRELDGSSAESGDSEIELVSEEPPKPTGNPFAPPPKGKDAFSQPNNPFDNAPVLKGGIGSAGNHAPPTAYSILREEREAELDSDLFIESASEESPKREQGFSGPKQGVSPPSPLLSSIVPPRSTAETLPAEPLITENVKTVEPVKPEEDRPNKPMLPTATVPPEVRVEKTQTDDMQQHTTKVKEDLEKPGALMFLRGMNKQKAIDLLYWRNVKQSGAVFSSVLLLLFSLTQFSVVSVGAYLALAALSATISFRIYKSVLQAVQKTDEGHPFKSYLEMEISLSQDQISKYADKILLYTNTCMKELRRLFLVQDLVDSLKFAVLMWLLTYVGALFNGLTLLILAVVSMFTMPVVYEKHQAQIDQYVGLIRTQVNSVVGKIQAKIPGAKRKEE